MKIKIDDIVIYDTQNRTLQHVYDSSSEQHISPRAVITLLDFFIANHNILLSKNYVVENAFKGTSFVNSEANFNKNLSLLRRLFKDVGFESDIIVTVPGEGFIFRPKLEWIEESVDTIHPTHKKIQLKRFLVFGVVMLLIVFVSIAALVFIKSPSAQCEFIGSKNHKVNYALLDKILGKDYCQKKGIIIFSETTDALGQKEIFIADCAENEKLCSNYIYR